MSGHTAGPWGVGNTGPDQIMLLGDGGKGGYVCHIQIQQCGGGAIASIMEGERKANARLIQQAPTLLVELAAALGYLMNAKIDLQTGCTKATAIRTIEGGIARAETALSKATGATHER